MSLALEQLRIKSEETRISVVESTTYVVNTAGAAPDQGYTLVFDFDTPSVVAEIIVPYQLGEKQALNLTIVAHHKAENTKCTIRVKGVLFDGSSSNFIGKIIIDKTAQKTVSYLHDDILVVGENTKSHSQPILQIDANDVRASHGATTGRIDEEQVYYLTSRGLSAEDAQNLIIKGFLGTLLDMVKDEKILKEFNL